jgi:hypothetical protein
LIFFSRASRMRAQGFGMMAELERDIVYQNVENAGAIRPGKSQSLKL